MKLTKEHRRVLRIIAEQDAHDTEDSPTPILQELIDLELARVTDRYVAQWGGKRHQCRMVGITDAGLLQIQGR